MMGKEIAVKASSDEPMVSWGRMRGVLANKDFHSDELDLMMGFFIILWSTAIKCSTSLVYKAKN